MTAGQKVFTSTDTGTEFTAVLSSNICAHLQGLRLQTLLSILQGMFIPAIEGQGTEEQAAKWLPLARSFSIIGCYAQTEMGHGSNVQVRPALPS